MMRRPPRSTLFPYAPLSRSREPHWERPGVVFDQDAEEALDRSVERAVDHQRLLAGCVFGYVFELEALRQVEVELYRRELPEASDGVDQFHVDLRPVERGFTGDGFIFDVQLLQRAFQGVVGQVPLLVAAQKAFLVVWIPGGKLGLEFIEAKIFQHFERELQASYDFRLDLIRSTKDVRVVLSEATSFVLRIRSRRKS